MIDIVLLIWAFQMLANFIVLIVMIAKLYRLETKLKGAVMHFENGLLDIYNSVK